MQRDEGIKLLHKCQVLPSDRLHNSIFQIFIPIPSHSVVYVA